MLVSGAQHSESATHTYVFPLSFRLHSHIGHCRELSRILCYAVSSYRLPILYIILSICQTSLQSYPPPLSLYVTISLFSTSVTQLLFLDRFFGAIFFRFHIYVIPYICLFYLPYFTQFDNPRSICVSANGITSFSFMAE